MDTKNKWLIWIIAGALLLVGVYLLFELSPQLLEEFGFRRSPGERAPDFALLNLNGEETKLSDFAGKVLVATFWTSWNEPSLEQLRILNGYHNNFKRSSLAIFAINSMEDAEVVRKVVIENDIKLEVLLDIEGVAGETYNIGMLPLTIFVDKAGFIAKRVVGPFSLEEIAREASRLRP